VEIPTSQGLRRKTRSYGAKKKSVLGRRGSRKIRVERTRKGPTGPDGGVPRLHGKQGGDKSRLNWELTQAISEWSLKNASEGG